MVLLELTFNEQLQITFLDKLLFAAIIVLTTYSLNRVLEKYKALQMRNNELLKMRVVAMSETWAKLYSWILDSDNTLESWFNGTKNLDQAKSEIREASAEVIKVIEKNRFLSGNEFSNDCSKYANSFLNYYMKKQEGWDNSDTYRTLKSSGESILTSLPTYLTSLIENSKFKIK